MYPTSNVNANNGNSGLGNSRHTSFRNNGFANSGGRTYSYSWGNWYMCQLFLIPGVGLLVLFIKIFRLTDKNTKLINCVIFVMTSGKDENEWQARAKCELT